MYTYVRLFLIILNKLVPSKYGIKVKFCEMNEFFFVISIACKTSMSEKQQLLQITINLNTALI